MLTLAVLAGLAVVLTLVAFKSRYILYRMAAILGWLGLGILAWTSPAIIGIAGFPAGAQYVMSLICAVMVFAVALMHMQTEIRHEQLVKGRQVGYPGAETASWTSWGNPPGKKKMTKNEMSNIRLQAYKQQLHEISERASKARRRRIRGY
jgi:hypothetical protein